MEDKLEDITEYIMANIFSNINWSTYLNPEKKANEVGSWPVLSLAVLSSQP